MKRLLQIASDRGLRVVVLDRPNPIGGVEVQGPVLADSAEQMSKAFVNYHPLPLRHGMTTIGVFQGPNTVIGAVGRVVRPIGLMVEEMTVVPSAGLTLSMGPRSDYDRMVQCATFREAFDELAYYIEKVAEKKYEEKIEKDKKKIDVVRKEARERGRELVTDDDIDDKHLNLHRLVAGRIGSILHCERAMDVQKGIELGEKYGFLARTTFILGPQAYEAASLIAKTGRPVVLDPNLVYREIDPLTGERKWEYKMVDFTDAGILTTASDLLFSGGREGDFYALDARNGSLLWKFTVGGQVQSGPVTYSVAGRQYVAVAAGSSLYAFALRR